jgi:hypothetical protein
MLKVRDVPIGTATVLHNFYKTLWPKCHIQWLYLAAHGCKTYLNLNLNLITRLTGTGQPFARAGIGNKCRPHGVGTARLAGAG